jgi:hypothetical protein
MRKICSCQTYSECECGIGGGYTNHPVIVLDEHEYDEQKELIATLRRYVAIGEKLAKERPFLEAEIACLKAQLAQYIK